MKRTALLGFAIGVTLGCLFGAIMNVVPDGADEKEKPAMLGVNQNTGKAQLHIKGKPEIK
ncbi:MAG: hypothetical protein ACR2G0_05510 [Chthoniobacterales bacterium]